WPTRLCGEGYANNHDSPFCLGVWSKLFFQYHLATATYPNITSEFVTSDVHPVSERGRMCTIFSLPFVTVPTLQHHLPQIRGLCRRYKMKRVWLFGSAAHGEGFGNHSDVDFLYEPDKARMSVREFLDFPLMIQGDLETLLGRKVDWIRAQTFRNPYFREEVEQTKQLVYSCHVSLPFQPSTP
ncbi:MAG: nucleotidyltransferase domain-containing protein, partial [Bacteroidota bacterium]